MAFKINVSHKGRVFKVETESEDLVGKSISETVKGEEVSPELEGYEIIITGTSDLAGRPGFEELEGTGYHRELLKYGPGMKDRRKGIRLRKTLRGREISFKTVQINCKVLKEGKKKFADLTGKPKGEAPAEGTEPAAEPAKEEPKAEEKPVEEKKEEKPAEPKEEPKKE